MLLVLSLNVSEMNSVTLSLSLNCETLLMWLHAEGLSPTLSFF